MHVTALSAGKTLSLFSKKGASNSNLLHVVWKYHVLKNSLLVCGTSSQNIPEHAPPRLQSPYFKKTKKKALSRVQPRRRNNKPEPRRRYRCRRGSLSNESVARDCQINHRGNTSSSALIASLLPALFYKGAGCCLVPLSNRNTVSGVTSQSGCGRQPWSRH